MRPRIEAELCVVTTGSSITEVIGAGSKKQSGEEVGSFDTNSEDAR